MIERTGRPWVLTDRPEPHPLEGQVLIRVHASGLCGTDLHLHHGRMEAPLPLVAGHEAAGEIVATGPGVHGLTVGDRVGVSWHQRSCGRCAYCRAHRGIYCAEAQSWLHLGGGNAELMLAWASGCTLLPDGLEYTQAAPIFCAGYTVFSGLRNAAPRPDERVAVLGFGGLGHLAIQFAVALGLETIAVTGQPAKAEQARRLGATEVVLAPEHVGRGLLQAGGADVILSTTNSARQVGQALIGLRPEGRLVNMGLTDGPIEVDVGDLTLRQKRIIGSIQNQRRDLMEALDMVAASRVVPAVEVYPLDEINKVRDRLEAGQVRFRAVLVPRGVA